VRQEPRDLVVLKIVARKGARTREALMVNRYDSASGLTAMARTTALTTAVTAQLVARGGVGPKGVLPLERLAGEPGVADFILGELGRRNVRPEWREI
jgi:saccharopine dehydrogenase-like NADP-dependent oxidoreductase